MRTLILYLLLLFIPLAHAETAVYTEALTWHPWNTGLNGHNRLLAVEHNGVMAGYFYNSYRRDTFFAAYRWARPLRSHWVASLVVGADYGYSNCLKGQGNPYAPKRVCPMVVPGISYTAWRAQPTLVLMGDALSVTLRWRVR